jgi:arsenate reductase (thioredoxin)
MDVLKVLFVCVHNSARSQMAEAYLNKIGGDRFKAESAGLEPGKLNPIVVEAMKEDGIDISGKETNSVFDYLNEGREYDYVITVCDESSGERCPIFPTPSKDLHRLHWGFPDPSSFSGTHENKLKRVIEIRDDIKKMVSEFVKNNN